MKHEIKAWSGPETVSKQKKKQPRPDPSQENDEPVDSPLASLLGSVRIGEKDLSQKLFLFGPLHIQMPNNLASYLATNAKKNLTAGHQRISTIRQLQFICSNFLNSVATPAPGNCPGSALGSLHISLRSWQSSCGLACGHPSCHPAILPCRHPADHTCPESVASCLCFIALGCRPGPQATGTRIHYPGPGSNDRHVPGPKAAQTTFREP